MSGEVGYRRDLIDEVWLVWDMFGEIGLVSGRDRRRLFGVGTCSAMSAKCKDWFDKVGLVLVRVRRGRISVGTCSTRSDLCRAVFGEVGSGRVRRGFLTVETCSAMSG